MADIAAVFHWPPDVLAALPLDDLVMWHEKAVARWNAMNGTEER